MPSRKWRVNLGSDQPTGVSCIRSQYSDRSPLPVYLNWLLVCSHKSVAWLNCTAGLPFAKQDTHPGRNHSLSSIKTSKVSCWNGAVRGEHWRTGTMNCLCHLFARGGSGMFSKSSKRKHWASFPSPRADLCFHVLPSLSPSSCSEAVPLLSVSSTGSLEPVYCNSLI